MFVGNGWEILVLYARPYVIFMTGGVFMPSFALGAVTGRAFGEVCVLLLPNWHLEAGWFAVAGVILYRG